MIVETMLNGLFLASVYALVAFGLALIYGVMHILNFAHGALLVLGAYVAVACVSRGASFWLALPTAVAALVVLGVLLERFLYRRGQAEPMSALIVSIGVIAVVASFVSSTWGPDPRPLPRMIDGSVHILGGVIQKDRLLIIAFTVVALGALQWGISKARWGKLLRATAQSPDAALLQGVPVARVRAWAFAVSAGLAALAGCVLGTTRPIEPGMGDTMLLKAFIVIIVGGVGSTWGTLIGALTLGVAESFSITYTAPLVAQVVPLVVLVVVLLVRPQGLLGSVDSRV